MKINIGQWKQLLSSERLRGQTRCEEGGRSEFRRDYDRIVFSSAFRRLADKTQVFPLSSDDSTHTRLTHSLEVASAGYALGHRVGDYLAKNRVAITGEDVGTIVAAACLAHDIGNPPFGHSGETAIQAWIRRQSLEGTHALPGSFPSTKAKNKELTDAELEDLRNFEGNAQGFRVLAVLAERFRPGGMRPTLATIGAMFKYPCESVAASRASGDVARKKFGYFQAERKFAVGAFERLGLKEFEAGRYGRHPLAYLVEAADDLCNSIIDLEDSFKLGIVPFSRVQELLMPISSRGRPIHDHKLGYAAYDASRVSGYRAAAIQQLVEESAEVFLSSIETVQDFGLMDPLVDHLPSKASLEDILSEVRSSAYRDTRVLQIEYAGFQAISGLLDMVFSAVHRQDSPIRDAKLRQLLPGEAFWSASLLKRRLKSEKDERDFYLEHLSPYARVLLATDYVAGMTDTYAVSLYQKLSGIRLPS